MNQLPEAKYLHEIFEYQDGALYNKVRPRHHFSKGRTHSMWNARFAGKRAGRQMPTEDYRQVSVDNVRYLEHRIIAAMHGLDTSAYIDHRDGNGLNNSIENLRSATQQQNMRNMRQRPSKSLMKGVGARSGKYVAYIGCGDQQIHLGTFKTEEDAVVARLAAESRFFGEFSHHVSRRSA